METDRSRKKKKMIDLHCHILPGIDDGAKNVEDSLTLLREEKRQHISSIVFTPHFNFERISLDEFVQARKRSFELLSSSPEFQQLEISAKLGAEVYFSVKLNEYDLDPLCFEGTKYILIELSTGTRPYGLTHTMTDLLNRGYIPILAHVERYPYFADNPVELYNLVMKGCVAQVNAGAIIGKNEPSGGMAMKYLKWEIAQLISSDAHSMQKRPPRFAEAVSVIRKKLGDDYAEWVNKNSGDVFKGRYVDVPVLKKPKKILGKWI